NRLFSQKTRGFLRRGVWRYFRTLAHRDAERYRNAIAQALAIYDDSHFDSGEAILDNWSLMHACYFGSPVIAFTNVHTNVRPGQALAELQPAPYRAEVWLGDDAAKTLWRLLLDANSQFVRLWSLEMLRRFHSDWLSSLPIETLLEMLGSANATLGTFAAELFRSHPGLPSLDVETWLRLLDLAHFSAIALVAEAMEEHCSPDRLTSDQLVDVTTTTPAATAQLGWSWLRERHEQDELSSEQLGRLTECRCESASESIAKWAIEQLTSENRESLRQVVDFFDARSQPIRRAACQWLSSVPASKQSVGNDPRLWAKLVETPYDEVRFALLDHLQQHLDGEMFAGDMRLCSAVLLCVDRGSRSKPKAVQQLIRRVDQDRQAAEVVLPVLAATARSVRVPEHHLGLSALAELLERHPELSEPIQAELPEWDWTDFELSSDA
ncbi:MAG: hypothetical protein AAFV88_25945, partial [Planctomycetota bacterium]